MESQHPLNKLLEISIANITLMAETGKIVGQPIPIGDTLIIPISKVSFGFGAAGADIPKGKKKKEKRIEPYRFDSEFASDFALSQSYFGGGSGGGVTITPSAFLVIDERGIEVKTIQGGASWDKLGQFIDSFISKNKTEKKGATD